jgi:hypothetical protein
MTRRTNARVAGVTYIVYIALAFPSMLLFGRATAGDEISGKLANVAEHAADMRMLGVSLYVLLVVGLPLQLAGLLHGSITQAMWLPMAAFEIPLGFWLMTKGVAIRSTANGPRAIAR